MPEHTSFGDSSTASPTGPRKPRSRAKRGQTEPNYASAYAQLAMDEITPAELPLAIANLDQAIKVSPRDPEMDRWRWIKGMTFNYMSRYQDAIREIQSALDLGYSSWAVYTHLAVAYAFLGQQSETEAAVAQASHTKLEADH
jgi:Flp pilus assembly protein TadD